MFLNLHIFLFLAEHQSIRSSSTGGHSVWSAASLLPSKPETFMCVCVGDVCVCVCLQTLHAS